MKKTLIRAGKNQTNAMISYWNLEKKLYEFLILVPD